MYGRERPFLALLFAKNDKQNSNLTYHQEPDLAGNVIPAKISASFGKKHKKSL